MLRDYLFRSGDRNDKNFRWRGSDTSRIEGVSDAVFAFAITLLVVSQEVPKTYPELLDLLRGFVPFGVCFLFLAGIWYSHYFFFRRYGLNDRLTIFLNGVLLFLVLFYIFPLKFLATMLFNLVTGYYRATGFNPEIRLEQAVELLIIYSLGYFAIFMLFLLLHIHALRKLRHEELDALEILMTRQKIYSCAIHSGFALFAIALAFILGPRLVMISGMSYVLIGPASFFLGNYIDKQKKLLETAEEEPSK